MAGVKLWMPFASHRVTGLRVFFSDKTTICEQKKPSDTRGISEKGAKGLYVIRAK